MGAPRADAKCRMTFLPFAVIMFGAYSRLPRIWVRQPGSYKRVETFRTASFCGMAGFGRHGADRADAGHFTLHADGYGDGRHAVQHRRRLRFACCACRSAWDAGASERSHRALRLLRTVLAHAGGGVRRATHPAAGAACLGNTASGVAIQRTCRATAECTATWATAAHQRLM